MNKHIAAIALSLLLAGCPQNQESEGSANNNEKQSATQDSSNDGKSAGSSSAIADKDKMAYAIGTNMADSVTGINKEFEALTMDLEVVKQGFSDRMDNKSLLTDEEIQEQSKIFQQKMQFAQQQKVQEATAAKATENEAYLTENLAKGFTKTESGLQYKMIEPGEEGAAKPSATDKVRVHYTGTFTDGREFDSSKGKSPFEFSLTGGVIQGWLEGVKLMSVGSKYQFVIPPELAYGNQNRGPIPGGSILLFDIELLEIVAPAESKEDKK